MSDAIFENEEGSDVSDPDESPPVSRDVFTQPYDLVVESLVDQIAKKTIFLRPTFQRGYVWSNPQASRLIESIILNVPIPPCYLSQNEDFELDVVDGQQRLMSIHRFLDNQFSLSSLKVLSEYNNFRFHNLPTKVQRKIKTHTIRCITITNQSHPDVKFDIFERLNSNTVSLNAQELRNCIYRGTLNNLLIKLAQESKWLSILGRKTADKRMNGEETILRYFAFRNLGISSYKTPLKVWLNDAANQGRSFSSQRIAVLEADWNNMLSVSCVWFPPSECFRRPRNRSINKALFDLISSSASGTSLDEAKACRDEFRKTYSALLANEEFDDLISRSVDHKRRTVRRFELWGEFFSWLK